MPRGPKGEKRPGDVIGAAIMVGRIATGDSVETATKDESKSRAGKAGGQARASKLSKDQRVTIATNAARSRKR